MKVVTAWVPKDGRRRRGRLKRRWRNDLDEFGWSGEHSPKVESSGGFRGRPLRSSDTIQVKRDTPYYNHTLKLNFTVNAINVHELVKNKYIFTVSKRVIQQTF